MLCVFRAFPSSAGVFLAGVYERKESPFINYFWNSGEQGASYKGWEMVYVSWL